MRILILGGSGMLGHRLWIELSRAHETWVTVRGSAAEIPALPGIDRRRILQDVEATRFDEIVRAQAETRAELIINCIGIVKQRPRAKDPIASLAINSLLPHRLALLAQASGARLIHFSTDCVFSGRKEGLYTEDDAPDAEDLYGRSKLLGEVADRPQSLTLRTSIIGREIGARHGLVEWFLAQGEAVRGYRKAIFSGLTTGAVARVLLERVLPNPGLKGLYHVSSEPISKHDLLILIRKAYDHRVDVLPDDAFVCNRALDSSRFRAQTGFAPAPWPEMIEAMRAEAIPHER